MYAGTYACWQMLKLLGHRPQCHSGVTQISLVGSGRLDQYHTMIRTMRKITAAPPITCRHGHCLRCGICNILAHFDATEAFKLRKHAGEQGLTYWAYCLLSLLTVLRFLLSERLSSLGLPPACCNDVKI